MMLINLTLLITNIWISVYTSLLDYLNFKFPAVVKITFYRPEAVFPEPFEIRLYLLLMFIFTFIIWIVSKYLYIMKWRIHPLLNSGLFIFLTILFIRKIGGYPLAGDLYNYARRTDTTIYQVFFVLYLFVLIFLIAESSIFSKLIKDIKTSRLFTYAFVILINAFATFRPSFPITRHDESFFLGPMWEILNGKTLYTDVPSQYGFLSILTLAFLNKINILNFFSLPVLIWFLYIVEYTLCFYLIFKTSRSVTFSFIGLFSILTINYFSEYHTPQTGPLRWIPLVLALFLLSRLKRIESRSLILSISFLNLWFVDSGIALISAYVLTLFWLFISKYINLKKAFYSCVLLFFSAILILTIINAIHFIFGFRLINFTNLLTSLKKHAVSGLVMVPMEFKSYFWIVLLIYFASLIYFFRNVLSPSYISHLTSNILILFSANLMFFASIYYVGRSVPHNLFIISLFALLTLFLLIGLIYNQIRNFRVRIIILIFLFLFMIACPAYQKKELIAETILHKFIRLSAGIIFQPEGKRLLEERYRKEIDIIKPRLKEKETIILSTDDTYLLYALNKKNILDINPLASINTKEDMNHALRNLPQKCPSKIVVDCTVFKKCEQYESFTKGWQPTIPLFFKETEKICNTIYKPTICTNQLCLAEIN